MGQKAITELLRDLLSVRKVPERLDANDWERFRAEVHDLAECEPKKARQLLEALRLLASHVEAVLEPRPPVKVEVPSIQMGAHPPVPFTRQDQADKPVPTAPPFSSEVTSPELTAVPIKPLAWAPVAWGCTRSTDHKFLVLPDEQSNGRESRILSYARFAVRKLGATSTRGDARWVFVREVDWVLLGVACSPRALLSLPTNCWYQEPAKRPIGAVFLGLIAKSPGQAAIPCVTPLSRLNAELETIFALPIGHLERGWAGPGVPPARVGATTVSHLEGPGRGPENTPQAKESRTRPVIHAAADLEKVWAELTSQHAPVALCTNLPNAVLHYEGCPFRDITLAE